MAKSPPPPVLIVEDDQGIRDIVKQLLEYHGFKTYTAVHGQDALDQLATLPELPLILMDVMMPVLDGWSTLAIIRQKPEWKKVPVVILSAGADTPQILDDPFLRFLRKPLRMAELVVLVQSLCPS